MTDRTDAPIDENDVALLLPWYAAGTLDEPDRRRVERFLAEHPEQRGHLRAIEEERAETTGLARAMPQPSPGSFDAILSQTRREPRREARAAVAGASAPTRGALARGLAAISGWLEALSPPMRGAAIAALMLLAVTQAGVIGALVSTPADTPFEVATGEAVVVSSQAQILAMFAPDATAGQIAALLTEIDARIVDGPRAGGVFALACDGEAGAALAALQASPLVSFAAAAQ